MKTLSMVSSQKQKMTYPRPVTTIKQIEVTTHCNLRCVYCPSPNLPRPYQHMEMEVYKRALIWADYFQRQGTQGELSLTGIGEGLMHPEIVKMVAMARAVLPDNPLVIATNGILLDDEMGRALAPYRPRMFISLHRPEMAGPAIEVAKKYGIFAGENQSFVTSALDWAGQVDWHVSAPVVTCEFLRSGWGVVMAEGKITTCCLDATGDEAIGHVNDEPGTAFMKPYSLCSNCYQEVP